MQTMRKILAVIGFSAACAWVVFLVAKPKIATVNQGAPATQQESAAPVPVQAQKTDIATDPVSLQALQQKEYDGRDLRVGPVQATTDAYTRSYITYKSGDLTISGIMNVPHGAGPFPVLFLNHGYIDPAVYTNGRGLKREQDYLARQGFVVIHSDYRNHAQSDKEENPELRLRFGYVEDVINAIMAVKNSDLPYFDKHRLGMLGHSMGGGIALNIMVVKPDLVDAVVLFAPVSSDTRDNFNKWTRSRAETAEAILAKHGTFEENPSFWDNVSAQTYFHLVQTPVLIHHGTADESCPLEWSQATHDKLVAAGKNSTLHIYRDEPHEFIDDWPLVMQRTAQFFYDHLNS